ncbi:MAG: hypothetical protein QM205_05340 [Bacillota bacterium]|jgi:hypothetical protein|nr:hypothetical protein [Bacillota bacterium]
MSFEEIENFYQQSYCVWLFYKDSTQSGVLPMCYKNGSAVLSSNAPGLVQNIVDGVTGYIFEKYSVNAFDLCI